MVGEKVELQGLEMIAIISWLSLRGYLRKEGYVQLVLHCALRCW
jgi:hypothetical protein